MSGPVVCAHRFRVLHHLQSDETSSSPVAIKNHHQLMREVNLPLPNLITSSCKAKAVLLRVPKSPLMVQKVPERYWSKIFFPPLSVS